MRSGDPQGANSARASGCGAKRFALRSLSEMGARIVETVSRVRIAFAAAHPEAVLFSDLARCLQPARP